MSKAQEVLFDLLGDVNPQYALKYMTTFLLKFARKDEVAQKRPDIFVEALEKLNYICKNDQGKYQLNMIFDKETLILQVNKLKNLGYPRFLCCCFYHEIKEIRGSDN